MKVKQFLNILLQEFVYGGHLISLGIPAIVSAAIILLNRDLNFILLINGYLLTFISYRYNYYWEIQGDSLTNPDRVQYLGKSLKFSQFLIIIYFFILCVFLIAFTNFKIILFSIFFLMIGILYTRRFKKITKRIAGFKNLYIGFSWALFMGFISLYYSFFDWILFFLFLFIFLRLLLNTIFFDIKDIEADKRDGIKTIPVILGQEKIIKFLHILNILSFMPIMVGFYLNYFPKIALALLIFYFYSFYYIEKLKDKDANIRKISYLIVDSEYFLWPIILLLAKAIE